MRMPDGDCEIEQAASACNDIGAIVLAAGYSSRMGQFKPLLPFAGSTVLQRAIGLFKSAGVDNIVVVLGHRAGELKAITKKAGARWVVNPKFAQGMFTSVREGARSIGSSVSGCFVLPGDMPSVRSSTIRSLADAFLSQSCSIAYPCFEKRRGHPPLIARHVLEEAVSDEESGPLFSLLERHSKQAIDVPVADAAVVMDMDTYADYLAHVAMAASVGYR